MAKHKNDEIWQQVKKLRRYGFWIIIIVLTVLTIRDVIDLIIEYNEDPKQSQMNIIFNESMSMPNITFCMSKKQAWSHFKIDPNETAEAWDKVIQNELANMTDAESFLKTKWDYRMTMEAYEVIATLNSLERETTHHGAARAMTVFRINPRLAGKRKLIKPVFDEDNFKDINDQGQFFILQTSHGGNINDSFDCMSVDFHGRPSALGRFMEGKGRVKDGVTDELCLGMVHEVNVEVRATYIMLENDDVGTACNEIEDEEDSEFNCRSRCRMEVIKKMCNCIAPTLHYLQKDDKEDLPICDYEKCKIDVQRGNFSDEECSKNCLRDCKQIRYQISLDQKGRSVRPDLTTVVLNWGSFEYLSLEQQYVWSVATFIAALGGSIGMWLGLSILSLIQGMSWIMENFGNRFCIKFPENGKNSKAPNMTKMNTFDVKRNKTEPA